MLSRKEFVVNSRAASKWAPQLHAINSGAEPSMQQSQTMKFDDAQIARLTKPMVMSSNRMLLDHEKAVQMQARVRV
jgi:hypothetical protein